jgi:hypothetical protein
MPTEAPDMTDSSLSRRSLLRTTAGGLATGAVAGLAGCSGILGGGGGGAASSTTRAWAYEPSEGGRNEPYPTEYHDIGAFLDHEDDLSDDVFDAVDGSFQSTFEDRMDVDIEDADWRLRFGANHARQVVSANHDAATAIEELEADGFDEDDEIGDFSTAVGPSERQAAAVDGSTAIFVVGQDPTSLLETLIGTQGGETELYADENEEFAAAVDALDGDVLTVNPTVGVSEQLLATAEAASFGGDRTTVKGAVVYDDGDAFSVDDLEFFADAFRDQGVEDVQTSKDGRVGTIRGEIDTADYRL